MVDISVADLEKIKGVEGGWIGMDSTDPWSNGLDSLNPKCHYENQELREWLTTLFTPPGSETAYVL